MSLNYEPPRYTHALQNGQSITVSGINVEDLSYLVQKHGSLLEMVFEGGPKPVDLLMKAPALAADILACGAGDREAAPIAARMPLGLQVLLLTKIFELSMCEIEMGEFFGALVRTFRSQRNPVAPAI